MNYFAKPLENLIGELEKLPGIGPKTAQRLAIHLIKQPKENIVRLTDSLLKASEEIKFCSICANLTSQDPCDVCRSNTRDNSTICVINEVKDLAALERTKQYNGLYHVLCGLISPMDGIGPEDLKIKELLKRLTNDDNKTEEVILALNSSIEGDATTLYLSKILKPFNIKVTRIAFGLPMGGELEYADELTLARALEGRREI